MAMVIVGMKINLMTNIKFGITKPIKIIILYLLISQVLI